MVSVKGETVEAVCDIRTGLVRKEVTLMRLAQC